MDAEGSTSMSPWGWNPAESVGSQEEVCYPWQ